ncbi:MAG: hypothetical protein ACUVX1_17420 [Chloroflexota bacterium]
MQPPPRIEFTPAQRQYILWLDQKIAAARREAEHFEEALRTFLGTIAGSADGEPRAWRLAPDGSALILTGEADKA